MPPHNLASIAPPRTLGSVLADLRAAKHDLDDALADCVRDVPDAEDRANEAERRKEDLQEEFYQRFHDATGLTLARIMEARELAII